jgi:hypothetical protein
MTLEDFEVADFPIHKSPTAGLADRVVYVFCIIVDSVELPFYVGQTNRFLGRMRDYCLANFTACTDYCVGEAIKYLTSEKHCRVVVRYRASSDPLRQEKAIIRRLLLSGIWLLNCLPRYDYRTEDEEVERDTVCKFCDMLIESSGAPNVPRRYLP